MPSGNVSSNFRTQQISLAKLSKNEYVANEERIALAQGHDWSVFLWWPGTGEQLIYCDYRTAQAFERVYRIAVRDTQASVCRALGLTAA